MGVHMDHANQVENALFFLWAELHFFFLVSGVSVEISEPWFKWNCAKNSALDEKLSSVLFCTWVQEAQGQVAELKEKKKK